MGNKNDPANLKILAKRFRACSKKLHKTEEECDKESGCKWFTTIGKECSFEEYNTLGYAEKYYAGLRYKGKCHARQTSIGCSLGQREVNPRGHRACNQRHAGFRR